MRVKLTRKLPNMTTTPLTGTLTAVTNGLQLYVNGEPRDVPCEITATDEIALGVRMVPRE